MEGGGASLVAVALEVRIDYARAGGDDAGANFMAFATSIDDLLDIVDAILAQDGPWPERGIYDYNGDKYQRSRLCW